MESAAVTHQRELSTTRDMDTDDDDVSALAATQPQSSVSNPNTGFGQQQLTSPVSSTPNNTPAGSSVGSQDLQNLLTSSPVASQILQSVIAAVSPVSSQNVHVSPLGSPTVSQLFQKTLNQSPVSSQNVHVSPLGSPTVSQLFQKTLNQSPQVSSGNLRAASAQPSTSLPTNAVITPVFANANLPNTSTDSSKNLQTLLGGASATAPITCTPKSNVQQPSGPASPILQQVRAADIEKLFGSGSKPKKMQNIRSWQNVTIPSVPGSSTQSAM